MGVITPLVLDENELIQITLQSSSKKEFLGNEKKIASIPFIIYMTCLTFLRFCRPLQDLLLETSPQKLINTLPLIEKDQLVHSLFLTYQLLLLSLCGIT